MHAVLGISENVSSWMNADTGYHKNFVLRVILVLMLASVAVSIYRRILGLLNMDDLGILNMREFHEFNCACLPSFNSASEITRF